jgi:hypothetical protein
MLVGAAGCGAARPAPPVVSTEWQANARQVVQQLRVDIAAAAVGGTTNRAAAKALRDTSDLYALLVAYSDLAGCRQMVSSAAPPARVSRILVRACRHLERASALFSRATQRADPASLVEARHEVALAQPALVRAMLAIRNG